MHFSLIVLSLLTAVSASAVPSFQKRAPKLLISSDSTTANYVVTSAQPLQGWGYYINNYTTLPIVNLARNGRSTRSFINEGLWATLLASTAAGDFVVIEMGHNDDGDPTMQSDRATLPGIANNSVVVTTTTGKTETVYSFGWYLRKMIVDVRAKGATPILSGMVNRNYWTGNVLQAQWPFAVYAKQVGAQTGVRYIDHTKYSVNRWQALGPTVAKTYFPNDNTHTNSGGALINAQSFATAIRCTTSGLTPYLNKAALALPYAC